MKSKNSFLMTSIDWLLLISLSILWGGSFFFNRIAVTELPPFVIVTSRVSIGSVFLLFFVHIKKQKLPRSIGIWSQLIFMGLVNNVIPFSLIVWGQTSIASGLASILNATTPLFTILIAHLFTPDEKITIHKAIGLLVGFIGVFLVIGPTALSIADITPQLAVLTATCSYAVAGVFGRRFHTLGLDPLVTATGQVISSTAILVPITLLTNYSFLRQATTSLPVFGSLIGLGLFSNAIAYTIYFLLLSRVGATNLLLVTFLIPITAMVLGSVFFNERIVTRQVIGMLIVFTGIIVSNRRCHHQE